MHNNYRFTDEIRIVLCLSILIGSMSVCGLARAADCKSIDDTKYSWDAFDEDELIRCQRKDGKIMAGRFRSSALSPKLLEGISIDATLQINDSAIYGYEAIILSEIASKQHDVMSLKRYCNKFYPHYVKQTICSIGGSGEADWSSEEHAIDYIPNGVTLKNVVLQDESYMIALHDTMLEGGITFDGVTLSHVDNERNETRIEMKRCVIIGDVVIRNMENTTLLLHDCIVFGDIHVEDSHDIGILTEYVGIDGDISLNNIIDLYVYLRLTDIRKNLKITNIKYRESTHSNEVSIDNVIVSGRFILNNFDQRQGTDQQTTLRTRNLEAWEAHIENSYITKEPCSITSGANKIIYREVVNIGDSGRDVSGVCSK